MAVFLSSGVEADFKAWRKIFWRKAGAVLTGRIKLTPTLLGDKGKKKKKCDGKCKCKEDGGKCSSDEEEEEEVDEEVLVKTQNHFM